VEAQRSAAMKLEAQLTWWSDSNKIPMRWSIWGANEMQHTTSEHLVLSTSCHQIFGVRLEETQVGEINLT
jgi:hypothetical protein